VVYRSRLYLGPDRGGERRDGDQDERRIAGIEFVGNRFATKRQLRRQLGVATRDRYHRSRLLAGLEKIRDWYFIRGFPEIELSHEVIDAGERVRLVITVDEGDQVLISIPGAPRPKRPLLRDLYRLWSRGIFREDLLEEGVRLILDSLRDRGFARASVETGRPGSEPGTEKVVFTIDPGPRVLVDEIRFTGLEQVTEKEIRRRMLTRKGGLFRRAGFSPETLEDDVEAIRNYYATLGFLDAAVESRTETMRDDGTRVAVTIAVEEGARYRLGRVTFAGNEAVGGDALLAETGLDPGTPFNDQAVREGERKLAAFYDGRGFSGTGIRSDLRVDREGALVDVAYRVEEGEKLVVEEVEVVSPGITNPEVIRRELELWAGDPFSSRKADRSQYNLYRTGLFRSVGYEVQPGDTPESRRVVFSVEESPNFHFDYSLGYNSDFGIRVGGNVAHSNLFGRGLYLGFGGRYSGDDSRAQLLLRQPRIMGTEIEGLVRGYWEEEDRVSFDATRLGGVLQGTRRFRDGRYTLIWGYGLEDLAATEKWLNSAFLQPERPAGTEPLIDPRLETETRLGRLRLDAARDTRDTFLWPASGSYLRAELGVYDELLLSEAEYLRGFFQWNYYRTLFRSTIWISAVRLGLAEPYGNSEYLPVSERFFTGGESSLRGFRYDRLQPVGFPDLPGLAALSRSPGGNALFLFNQELAVPVADPVHLLFFYDAGNLYWQVSDFDPTDLRHAAGLGVRVRTPVGPLRLEYGWKLDREDGESPGRFHFSFGMPF
jgi:outer membrane protein insertion porin family